MAVLEPDSTPECLPLQSPIPLLPLSTPLPPLLVLEGHNYVPIHYLLFPTPPNHIYPAGYLYCSQLLALDR